MILQRSAKAEAATGGVLYKNVFLKISQSSQENTRVPESLFDKSFFSKKAMTK